MESERTGLNHGQNLPAHPQPADEACKNDIISFKKKMGEMRKYFLYGVDPQSIEDAALAEFDKNLRDFHRKMDEWEQKQYRLDELLNTPGGVVTKIGEAERLLYRARSLLKINKRTERQDGELFDKYKFLGKKAEEIAEAISLDIKEG